MNKKIDSGISIRESQVLRWLNSKNFRGEYLLVSTKPGSVYSQRLLSLPPDKHLIVDLYTPVLLEKELTLTKWKPQDWLTRRKNRQTVKNFLQRGNHFLVANRRQREYWIKISGDLGVKLEKNDISVLPTGSGQIQNSEFRIQNSSRRNVVLWFGGIYPWMDPHPLIKAFSLLSNKQTDWKLRLLGGFHPDTGYRQRYDQVVTQAKRLIGENRLEIVDWQKPENLRKYLSDVAFAVHLAKSTPEDYYAHRVRLLTLLSGGIGVLTSGKDIVSDLIIKLNAGKKINDSPKQLAKALMTAMNDFHQRLTWVKNAPRVEHIYIKQEMDIRF